MSTLNFSSFLHIVKKYANKKAMTFLVRGFLEEPIRLADIRDSKRKRYKLSPSICSDLYKGNEDLYPNLRKGLITYLNGYTESKPSLNVIYGRVVPETYRKVLNKELLDYALTCDNLTNNDKKKLSSLYSKASEKDFFVCLMYFVFVSNNKVNIAGPKRRKISFEDENLTAKDILDLLMSRPHPITIVTPDDIDESELNYVKELLALYSEKAKIVFKTKSELSSDPILLKEFEEQRGYYYLAESIRQGLRDTELSGQHFFDEYKSEVFESLKETSEAAYVTSEEKMKTILSRVTLIPLNSYLSKIPGWITASERKGTCHMLVNDGKMKWSKEDE